MQLYLLQKNIYTAENDQELINTFKHKVYKFLIYLLLISHRLSHFIIQFTTAPSSEERPELLVSFSGYSNHKITFSIPINGLVHYGLAGMDNWSLG